MSQMERATKAGEQGWIQTSFFHPEEMGGFDHVSAHSMVTQHPYTQEW